MLTVVSSHLRLVLFYFRLNLAAAMEYRGSFLLQTFGMALNNASFIIFWSVVYSRVGQVGGYGFQDTMFLWALSSSAFGLAHIVFGNVSNLANLIVNGELDTYLLQPKDVFLNVACSKTVVSAWGDLLYGLILFPVACGATLGSYMLFILFVVFGGLLLGSVIFAAEALTFYVGNSSAITRLVREFLVSFSLYPESIYQGWTRCVIYSIIPAGFVVFIPSRIMSRFSWTSLCVLVLVDLIHIFGAYVWFRRGLQRYESGNLVVSRL